MADSNALQFKIQFIEDANSLNDLIRRVTEKLNGAQIKLSVGDVDISKISGSLTQLESSIKEVQDLFSRTGDAASFKGMTEGLKAATDSMNNLKSTLADLNNTLGNSLGANIGNAIVQGLAQANDAIGTTMANLQKMNELASNKDLPKDLNQKVNLDLAKTKIAEIDNLMVSIGKRLEASKGLGFDAGKLDEFFGKLTLIRSELSKIVDAEGAGKRVDAVLRETQIGDMKLHYNEIKTQAAGEVRAYDEVTKALRQLREEDKKLENAEGVAKLRLEIMRLYESLSGKGGNKLLQSESFNAYFKDVISRTKEASKTWNEELRLRAQASQTEARERSKAVQEQQRQEAQETSSAQKIIQREISASKQKFNELYDVLTKLREKSFFSGVDASGPMGAAQQKLTALLNQYRQMEAMLKASPQQMTAFAQSDSLKTWRHDFDAGIKAARDGLKSITDSLKIDNILGNLTTRMQELFQLSREAGRLGLTDKKQELNDMFVALNKIRHELEAIKGTGSNSRGLGLSEYLGTKELSTALSNSSRLQAAARTAISAEERNIAAREKAVIRQNRTEATNEIARLKKAMQEINAIQAKSPGIKINGVDKALQDIQRIINLLEQAKERGRDINLIKGAMGSYSAQNAPQLIAQLGQNQQAAAQAALQHEQAQQRMAQAISHATGEASHQNQVLGDLRSMAAQYLSVWGASNFVKEVAQVTGELELQKKSLEVIVGSASKAQELFNDIKGMSQMSPYTFQDLLKSTRQLAAFGIETKDLYGTMKMLSDIGAGLDVDVQRLILAYGHIKSAGVLQGIQRRQLETAGIGISEELMKLYNERYRQAGSDERVTTKDVFKRITDRAVPFEDVEQVFSRLTGPGGKFYEMQLRQYDTLGGKLRNLRNNYNIMLDEIGKSYHNLLTSGVDTLNSLMEGWREWKSIIESVLMGLAAVKAAQLTIGKLGLTGAAAHRAAGLANKNTLKEAAMISAVGSGSGSLFPNMRQVYRNSPLDVDYAQKVLDSQMNKFQKARAVMYANVTDEAKKLLLVELGFKESYAINVAGMNRWELAFQRLRLGAMSFFSTMRAGFAALLANPMTWIFAVVAAVTAIVSRMNELDRMAESFRVNTRRRAKEDIEGIEEALNALPSGIKKEESGGIVKIDKDSIDVSDISALISDLDAALQKYDPLYKGHLFDLEQMEDEKDKAAAMIEDLYSAKFAKEEVKGKSGMLAQEMEKGGEWHFNDLINRFGDYMGRGNSERFDFSEAIGFNKTFVEELKEYEKEYTTLQSQIESIASDYESREDPLPLILKKRFHDDKNVEELIKSYYQTQQINGDMIRQYLTNMVNKDIFDGDYNDIDIDNTDMVKRIPRIIQKFYDGVYPTIKAALIKANKSDPSGKTGAMVLKEFMNSLFEAEGLEITDEETKAKITQAIILAVNDALMREDPEMKAAGPVVQEFMNQYINEATADFLKQYEMKNGDNVDMTKLQPAYEAYLKNYAISLQTLGQYTIEWQQIYDKFGKSVKSAWDTIKAAENANVNLKPWQEKIRKALDAKDFKEIKAKLKIDVDADADLFEFSKSCQKAFKEAKEKAEAMGRTLNIQSKLGIKIDADVTFGNMDSIKKLINAVDKYIAQLMTTSRKALERGDSAASADYAEQAEQAREYKKALQDLYNFKSAEKATGYNLTSDGKAEERAQKNAEKAAREKEKRERERERAAEEARRKEIKHFEAVIKAIADLRQEYKRLRDLGYNEEGAMTETKSYYDRMFKGKGIIDWSALKPDDITSVSPYLENINKLIDASSKLNKEDKDSLKTRALEQLMQAENMDLREKSDKLLAEFNTRLEEVTDSFSSLRTIMDTTGRGDIAAAVSGLGEQGVKGGRLSGQIERVLNQRIVTWYQENGLDLADLKDIDFGSVGEMSNDAIKKYVEGLFGNKETVGLVKPLIEGLKAYSKAVKDEEKASVDATAKTIAAAKEYNAQLVILDSQTEELNKKIRETKGLLPEQVETLIAQNNADRDLKAIQLEPGYARFMRGDTGQYLDDVNGMTKRLTDAYQTLFNVGRISTEELMQRLADIRKSRETYFTGKREELLDISTKGRLEKELKTLLQDFFKIAERAELAKSRRDKAMEAKEKALSKFNDLNNTYNENVEKGKLAREYERLAMQASNPQTRAEYERQAQELRDEIAKNEVKPSDIIKAQQAVDDAEMQIKMADITIQSTKKSLEDKNKEIEDKENEAQGERNARTTITKIVEHLKKFSEALDFVHSVLDSFGVDASALEDTISVIGGATQGAEVGMSVGNMLGGLSSALGNAGPWGAAAGAALGIAGQLAQIHDKNLQRRIDEIKLDTAKMSNTLDSIKSLRERQFGYDTGELRRILGLQYSGGGNANIGFAIRGTDSASLAMREYYTRYASGSGYEQELKLLEEQRQKLMEMYDLEASKKKKSKEDLEDYKKQIADLDEQIHFFVEDLAKELWGIDLKGWADQLGDALMTAFENGTSAASAFHDTVQDIMRNMVKSMLVTSVIEPAMKNLSEKLFGKDGNGGLLDLNNPKGSMGAVLAELGNWFNTEGPKLMDAANEFYNGADNMMRQTLGYGMRENERSSNTVNSIQSAASEETMGIVAGYLSRLSQDVSVQRIMQEMFVNGSWPNYIEQVTSVNDSVAAIDRSTTAMMEMMRDGTGALYERVENMSRRLDNFANGVDRIYIN